MEGIPKPASHTKNDNAEPLAKGIVAILLRIRIMGNSSN